MTRGAKSLLAFLRFRGGRAGQCWWRQAKIADELGCHRSSIVRWTAELVALGEIESIRQGSRANLYILRKSGAKQRSLPLQNATSVVAPCDKEKPTYKERGIKKQEKQAPLSTEEIQNPKTQRLLRDRSFRQRAENARNPEAYVAAAVRSTLGAYEWRKPPQCTSRRTEFIESDDGLEAFIAEHEARQRGMKIAV